MGREAINLFVDSWTIGWTALLALGYLADLTPWPRLSALRSPSVAKLLLLSSTAVVLGFTFAAADTATATIATWAIVFSSLNWLFHYFRSSD
ncbi:MAG TPA: hypothetical protein VMT87_10110 [Vicinamibacteria bacterium]|nr:hypothetical protein [Vicinamibacteria bacterium]